MNPAVQDPPLPRTASQRRRWLVLLLSPLVGLLMLEGGLRICHSQRRLYKLLYMPGLSNRFDQCQTVPELLAAAAYEWKPFDVCGDFVLNSAGLRTIEYAQQKPPETQRVVILGDSHSFRSGGVPDALLWHRRMEESLRAQGVGGLEVINLAVPAIGPDFELRMWQVEGRRLDPDLVILAFSVGTDFLEVKGMLGDRGLVDTLSRHWLTARLLRNASILWKQTPQAPEAGADGPPRSSVQGGRPVDEPLEVYDRLRPEFSQETHDRILYSRMSISDRERTGAFLSALNTVKHILRVINTSASRIGAPLVVLLIPDEHQVHPELLARVAEQNGRSADEFDPERAQAALAEFCAEEGIPCVAPLPAIRELGRTTPMYRPRETHLNDLGHDILAQQLIRLLQDQRLPPLPVTR